MQRFKDPIANELDELSQEFAGRQAVRLEVPDYSRISRARALLHRVFGPDSQYIKTLNAQDWGGVEPYEEPLGRTVGERKAKLDYLTRLDQDIKKTAGLLEAAATEAQEMADGVVNREPPPAITKLSCFLSWRFAGLQAKLYADSVIQFLQLLGIEVLTGDSYEPRSVSEKIGSRLENADFGVLIVTMEQGESFWTRDEINQLPRRLLIPLVEEGAKFTPGIFGDHEVIHFAPDHVGDAFIKLVEGVDYVRKRMA